MTNQQPRDNAIIIADGVGCEHCGQAITLSLPMPVDVAVKILHAFADLHQFCHLRPMFTADMVIGVGEKEGEVNRE